MELAVLTAGASVICAAASVTALLISARALVKATAALRVAGGVSKRLKEIGEDNVRAIMEDGGEASAESVLRVFKGLRDGGVLPDRALDEAREICKR